MFYVLCQDLTLRDLDQTGKNGLNAIPNLNKLAQQQLDKDLHNQQYFCMPDLGLDFKGPILKDLDLRDLDLRDLDLRDLVLRDLVLRDLDLRDLDLKDLVLRNSDLRDLYLKDLVLRNLNSKDLV